MKISELAAASGESIPTLKFYIRKGLLPAGRATGAHRAEYGPDHLSRLKLIAVLKDELGMSLERIAEIVAAETQGGQELLRSGLEAARHNQKPPSLDTQDPNQKRALAHLLALTNHLGWAHPPDDSAIEDASQALATILRVLPHDDPENFLEGYARAMKAIADQEIPDDFDPVGKPWETFTYAVLGTYLYEPLILSLRRLAHGQRAFEVEQSRQNTGKAEQAPHYEPAREQCETKPRKDTAKKRGRKGS